MKKKVAKGLLVAVVASNQVLGSSVAANGMLNNTDTSEITLETNTNTDVITEDQSTVVTNKTEESGANVSEETNSSTVTEEPSTDVTDKTEENRLFKPRYSSLSVRINTILIKNKNKIDRTLFTKPNDTFRTVFLVRSSFISSPVYLSGIRTRQYFTFPPIRFLSYHILSIRATFFLNFFHFPYTCILCPLNQIFFL